MHRKPVAAAFSGLLALTVALPVLAADIDAFKGLSGKLDIAGGTAHIPVVQDIARQVSKANPAIRISVTGGGSGVGVQKVGEGLVDIGSTGRKVSAEEIASYQLPSTLPLTVSQSRSTRATRSRTSASPSCAMYSAEK